MKKTVCPACNTQAYDVTSLFCHACGAPLSRHIPEKHANPRSGLSSLKKGPLGARNDSLIPRKPRLITHIEPAETCSRCGAPILDKNRVFCTGCSALVLDVPSGDTLFVRNSPVPSPNTPVLRQDDGNRTMKVQEPVQVQADHPIQPEAARRKFIIMIAGIAALVVMLVLVVILIFTFWTSLY